MGGEGPLAPGPMSVDGVEDQEFFLGQQGSARFAVRGHRTCVPLEDGFAPLDKREEAEVHVSPSKA